MANWGFLPVLLLVGQQAWEIFLMAITLKEDTSTGALRYAICLHYQQLFKTERVTHQYFHTQSYLNIAIIIQRHTLLQVVNIEMI